jgi:ComF family protein
VIPSWDPCFRCGRPGLGPLCPACRQDPPLLASASAPFLYEGQLKVAVQRFKYRDATYLSRPLGALMHPFAKQLIRRVQPDWVIPVPLHPRRLRERGYNQSALLAREVIRGAPLGIQYNLLRRARPTASQADLCLASRRDNVREAFVAHRRVRGKRLLLLDDVMTTGATAEACAAALLQADARAVDLLTLARAVP